MVFHGWVVDASSLYIDIVTTNGKTFVLIEKNGLTTQVPITEEELNTDGAIVKKVCAVMKCRDDR